MGSQFKNRVENLLKSKGMTQKDLANRMGVSEVTVSRWMSDSANGRNPSAKSLYKIAEALDSTPSYFLLDQTYRPIEEKKKPVDWGSILAGTALTATAVIGIVALAKAMGKLDEKDKEQIENILNRDE